MKRIRIGKDFTVLWTILTNKVASSLDGRDLSLVLHRPNHTEISLDFDLSEDTPNELRVRIAPEVQSSTGRYTLTLWENRGRNAQTVVDNVNAFELVPVTSMEYADESDESNLEIYPTVELETANMQVGITGPGVPDGGEVGQVIVKISEKNYDTEWRDARTLYGPELDEERERAERAEQELSKSILTESERARESEKVLSDAIDEEKRRAMVSERALSETIDNEGDTLRIMVNKLAQCVKSGATNESLDEMVRDMAELGTGYDTLYSLATTLKSFLTASDVSDTTINRWQEIESFLSDVADTDTLVGMLENLQSTITTNYRTEISNAVETETRRAQSAEEANQKDIVDLAGELSQEQERAEAAETANASAIVIEKQRAELAETRLSKNLTDEIARAKNAESANAAAILEESNRAKSAESDLSESIQSENNRAVDAEAKLKKRIDETQEGLSTETTRATGEEAVIRQEFAAADATTLQSAKNYTDNRENAVRTDLATNDAETLQSAKDYTDAVRQDERAIRQEAEQTVLTSAKKYTDVSLAAESADREAADKDALEQAKQHADTEIAAERVVREAAEREIQEAVTNYVNQKVAELVNGSPEALDTLLEISEALGNNPNFATDILAQLGEKVNKVEGKGLSTEDYTTPEKSKLAGIADGATNVSVKRELGRGTKIATISINGTAYDIYCQTNVDTTYSAGTGINLDGTTFSLSPSGVVEGTYGPATDVTGNEGQTISVPQITVDQYGRVTSVTNRLLTNKNTTYGTATPSTDGLMSAADKKNLDAFDGKKADKTVRIVAGTGLTGGGDLSSNVTLSLEEVATEGTYTKVHVDAQGRVNQGENLGVADVPNLPWSKITSGKPTSLSGYGITDAYTKLETDNRYVNAEGDKMTGKLCIDMHGNKLFIGNNNIYFSHYETTAINGHYFNKSISVRGEIYAGQDYNNKVWHAGNDGSDSGLDADKIDGKHLSVLTQAQYNAIFTKDANTIYIITD